jgi:hypothetical protein
MHCGRIRKNGQIDHTTLGFITVKKRKSTQEGMRIGKTPKKLDSICCPQRRETKADTLKQLRQEKGTRN